MTAIAFVGLGTMGLPMAGRLLDAGHRVVGCDLDRDRTTMLGGRSARTPAEAVAGAGLLFLSLPSPAAVADALFGDGGACSAASPGTVVIDTSTTSPSFARGLSARAEAAGLDWLDAPVSGGPHGAAAGTLTVMAGGRSDVLERCRPELEAIGRPILHVGGPGSGQAAKLCNNAVTACTMEALAEACEVARREGLDAEVLYRVLTNSTADSRVLRTRYPLPGAAPEHPSSRGFEALFSLDLATKDLQLARESAADNAVRVPLMEAALGEFRRAQALGLGAKDYSALYEVVRGTFDDGRPETP